MNLQFSEAVTHNYIFHFWFFFIETNYSRYFAARDWDIDIIIKLKKLLYDDITNLLINDETEWRPTFNCKTT